MNVREAGISQINGHKISWVQNLSSEEFLLFFESSVV